MPCLPVRGINERTPKFPLRLAVWQEYKKIKYYKENKLKVGGATRFELASVLSPRHSANLSYAPYIDGSQRYLRFKSHAHRESYCSTMSKNYTAEELDALRSTSLWFLPVVAKDITVHSASGVVVLATECQSLSVSTPNDNHPHGHNILSTLNYQRYIKAKRLIPIPLIIRDIFSPTTRHTCLM